MSLRLGKRSPSGSFAAALLLTALCAGCSFVFMPSPPSDPVERTPAAARACVASPIVPVLDSLNAGLGVVNIAIAANAQPGKVSWYGAEMEAEAGMGLGVAQLAIFGGAAAYGFVQAARCSDLRDEAFASDPDADETQKIRKPLPR